MTDPPPEYESLTSRLADKGLDVARIERELARFAVETPSWGYGDSGTRFGTFPQPGRPRNVFERVEDAAEVHRLTGAAPAVALHFPWDEVDDLGALRDHIGGLGLRVGAINPNLFQDPDYRLGSLTNPDSGIRAKALDHLLACVQMAVELGGDAQSLWLADGTNYAGQDDLRARRRRLEDGLSELYASLPEDHELLVEYKLFEPAFYATDIADWGSAVLLCQRLGPRARVLVDLGHHAQGVNIEQLVALLAHEQRLGGFHFNNRKYADDDLIVGSVNPFELFLIFCELVSGGGDLPRLTIDQSHNIEPKMEAMVLSVVNLQEAYARALLVDREGLSAAQGDGDVLAGHEILLDAYNTDVRPLCAAVRARSGAAVDPVAELRASGYADQAISREGGPMSVFTQMVAPVEDRWPGDRTPATDPLEEVLFASHLLGSNRALANYGGGNTSAKGTANDHVGRELPAIWVKGSGSDLATMSASDFTPLRLQEILPLFAREAMTDEEMVAHLVRCQLDPAAPRSSIETLLHAFIPAAHVHHTHPDAINVLACADGGAELVAECFGDQAAWVPYIRPGFALAKQVGEAVRAEPGLRLVVLAKHGLITWGDTAQEAYERTVWACNRAAELANRKTHGLPRFGGPSARARGLDVDARAATLRELLPALRGLVSSERSKILIPDLSPAVVELVDGARAAEVTNVGAACPDHLVSTKRFAMWVPYDPAADSIEALGERLDAASHVYRNQYAAYVERHREPDTEPADPNPRVVLIENVGLVAVGTSVRAAQLSRDLYHRAIEVMAGASAITEFVSLDEAESFAVEYWPLELYKLSLAPPPGELQGKVALVTGAAGGIGRAIVDVLSGAGACVVAFDIDGDGAVDAVRELGDRGVAVGGDVTSEADVADAFEAAVGAFGGVDIVVSNAGIASSAAIEDTTLAEWNRNQSILGTGYFLVAREAFRVLRSQRAGGAVVFVASKNALVAGQNAAAYSSAKAAELHLARCLAEEGGSAGIRVNTVNPDAVLHGSRIWGSSWREERAAAYGIAPEDLEEHYRNRTVLGVHILPEDIAQAVLHFSSSIRSGKSTGNLLNVDGGVTAAYPR